MDTCQIKSYRAKADMTQQQLAEKIGTSREMVARLETGGDVTPEMAARIEMATGGKLTRLMLRPDIFGDLSPQGEVA